MGDASFTQSSFLGGEWSLAFQGRTDHPRYKSAMGTCINAFPLEEGAWTRRPGFQFVCATRGGVQASLYRFSYTNLVPYLLELTDSYLRMINGDSLVFNNDSVSVTNISTANPAVVTIASDQGWGNTTVIQFFFNETQAATYPDVSAYLRNQQYNVTKLSGTTYSIRNSVTGVSIDGSLINFNSSHVALTAKSVMLVTSPFTSSLIGNVRVVQNGGTTFLLNGSIFPQSFTFTQGSATNIGSATLANANILDGPYLDIDISGAWLNASIPNASQPNIVDFFVRFPSWSTNTSYNKDAVIFDGSNDYISLVDNNIGNTPASSPTQWAVTTYQRVNGPNGFSSYDVGRCVRFKCEPAAWAIGTTYNQGDTVQYNGAYYVSQIASNVGNQPDTQLTDWLPTTSLTVATWSWGRITTTSPASGAAFQLEVLGPAVLYAGAGSPSAVPINFFRFGVYGDTRGGGQGYPTCGVFHQGRLWLTGAVANRFDASVTNQPLNFAPTTPDGTVVDSSGIAATANSEEVEQMQWIKSTQQGIVAGSRAGEWLIQSGGTVNDPITPTSITVMQVTHYGSANLDPVKPGIALVFAQKLGQKVLEFMSDVFSNKYSAPSLTETSKHMTADGVQELRYQEEPLPIIWARTNPNGSSWLPGLTYRRTSTFVSELPSLAAWHRHQMNQMNVVFESIAVAPAAPLSGVSTANIVDSLYVVVNDKTLGYRKVMRMAPLVQERILGQPGTTPYVSSPCVVYSYNHLDDSVYPKTALETTSGGKSGLRIYGLNHMEGQQVNVWAAGLDVGGGVTYTVTNGSIFVPYGADAGGLFTLANLTTLSTQGADSTSANYSGYWAGTTQVGPGGGASAIQVPIVVGHSFTSIGNVLRPALQGESGAQNGPAAGKTRRMHMFVAQLLNCVTGTCLFGPVDTQSNINNQLYPAFFKFGDGSAYTALQLFSGMHVDTIDDDYNWDSMLFWTINSPHPATVCLVGGFLHTQDR